MGAAADAGWTLIVDMLVSFVGWVLVVRLWSRLGSSGPHKGGDQPSYAPGGEDRQVAPGDAVDAREEPAAQRGHEVLERERLCDVLWRALGSWTDGM